MAPIELPQILNDLAVPAAVTEGSLSVTGDRNVIDAMIDHGWYVAPDVYTTVVGKLASFQSD